MSPSAKSSGVEGRLRAHHPPVVVDDHAVGERSADVEAAEILGHWGRSTVPNRCPRDSITITAHLRRAASPAGFRLVGAPVRPDPSKRDCPRPVRIRVTGRVPLPGRSGSLTHPAPGGTVRPAPGSGGPGERRPSGRGQIPDPGIRDGDFATRRGGMPKNGSDHLKSLRGRTGGVSGTAPRWAMSPSTPAFRNAGGDRLCALRLPGCAREPRAHDLRVADERPSGQPLLAASDHLPRSRGAPRGHRRLGGGSRGAGSDARRTTSPPAWRVR